VEAGAADLVPLDHGDPQASAGAVQRGCVTTRATTDHYDIEVLGQGDHLHSSCSAGNDRTLPTDHQNLNRERHQDGEPADQGGEDEAPGAHAGATIVAAGWGSARTRNPHRLV
jgi:hypothetical protein